MSYKVDRLLIQVGVSPKPQPYERKMNTRWIKWKKRKNGRTEEEREGRRKTKGKGRVGREERQKSSPLSQ